MDIRWVKIRAWHAVNEIADGWANDNGWVTRCGRWSEGPPVDDLPAERSCESCLRIVARLQDAA